MMHRASKLPWNWVAAELGQVVDVLDKHRVPINADERAKRSGVVPYYGATGQVGWIDDYLFDEELILLGEDGAPFLEADKPKAYFIRGKSWVNNHAHVLRGRHGMANQFILHQLNQVEYLPFVSGSTRLKLPQGPMVKIPLIIAPATEQRRIVAEIEKHFTRLDAAIAGLKRAQANLKRYRAAILKAACEGRLVPTEASLARAKGFGYEPADQLLKRILRERRANWEANEVAKLRAAGRRPPDDRWKAKYKEPSKPPLAQLTHLPDGWAWASPEQLASHEPHALAIGPFGSSLLVSDYRSEGVPLIFVRNIRSGQFSGPTTRFVSHQKAMDLHAHRVLPGDIVITKMGEPPGDARLYPPDAPLAVATSDCVKWTLAPTLQERRFFVHIVNSPVIKRQIVGVTQGVAQQKISLARFRGICVPLPPLAEQQRILEEIERQLSVIEGLETTTQASLRRASRLRQSILKRAFEGKLVPQDPNDKPASALLARINAERSTVSPGPAANGRHRKASRPTPIPLELPS